MCKRPHVVSIYCHSTTWLKQQPTNGALPCCSQRGCLCVTSLRMCFVVYGIYVVSIALGQHEWMFVICANWAIFVFPKCDKKYSGKRQRHFKLDWISLRNLHQSIFPNIHFLGIKNGFFKQKCVLKKKYIAFTRAYITT